MEFRVYKTFSGNTTVTADSLEEAIVIADGLDSDDFWLEEVDSVVEEE